MVISNGKTIFTKAIEIKKERYIYYHCSYSKGRQKECFGYATESRLSDLFAEPVRKIMLPEPTVEWFKRNLHECSKETNQLIDNRLKTLKSEYSKTDERLHRLFDLRLDGEIDEGMFKTKKNELENVLVDLKSKLRSAEQINPNFYEDGIKTLELCNSLYPQYLTVNTIQKAEILKMIASNYVVNDLSVTPTYRSPFSVFAKEASCPIRGGSQDDLGTDTSIQPYITLLEILAESMKDPVVIAVLESFDLWIKNAQTSQ